MLSVLRERRRIRDRVVEKDTERGEADRTAQIRRHDQQSDDTGHRQLRPCRDLMALLDDGEPTRQVAVARHRE